MQDSRVGFLQLGNDGAWVVARGFDNLDSFVDDHLRVGTVVWGNQSREQGQVHTKGVLGHGTASADLFPEVFRGRLCQSSELVMCLSAICSFTLLHAGTFRRTIQFLDHQHC